MTTKQVVGLILLIIGIAAVFYGLSIMNSFEYELVSAFGAGPSPAFFLMMGGGIVAAIVGMLLLVFGRKKPV